MSMGCCASWASRTGPDRRAVHGARGQEATAPGCLRQDAPHQFGARAPLTYRSGRDDVLRLRALLALRHVERDLLALLELTEALGVDVRVVSEDIGAAAVLLDETEALLG